jgi:hypothetical protein
MRFHDILSQARNVLIFVNPFSVEFSDSSEKLQLELTDLQCELMFNKWNQIFILFQSKSWPKYHVTKVRLWCFYRNVQFYAA